jgi:hypothetical protein
VVGAREPFDLESAVSEDGSFSIVIGGDPRSSNWMEVSADAEMIQLREYFGDWDAAEFSSSRARTRAYRTGSIPQAIARA